MQATMLASACVVTNFSYLLDTNMLQNLIANLLHDLGSRIVCLVDTVAKAHQPTHTDTQY